MNKKEQAQYWLHSLCASLAFQSSAQDAEPKFNSNADDLTKIRGLLDEFRQDITSQGRLLSVRRKLIRSHAAISSSQYSWCNPPRTSRALIRQSPGNSWRWILGHGRGLLSESGMPGPKLAWGRP